MSSFFSDIEIQIAKILSEHPERKNDPVALFEEVSGFDLGGGVTVHLHDSADNELNVVLPPNLDEISAIKESNNKLGDYFMSLFTGSESGSGIGVQQVVAMRARTEDGYLDKLKSSPKTALKEYFESELPESIDVKIYEDGSNDLHLCIPSASIAAGELSEIELGGVAGGLLPSQMGEQATNDHIRNFMENNQIPLTDGQKRSIRDEMDAAKGK